MSSDNSSNQPRYKHDKKKRDLKKYIKNDSEESDDEYLRKQSRKTS